jgi:hypothetical protein
MSFSTPDEISNVFRQRLFQHSLPFTFGYGYTAELSVTFPVERENVLTWAGLTYVARHFCGIPVWTGIPQNCR